MILEFYTKGYFRERENDQNIVDIATRKIQLEK